jgi:hypothetical protein
LQAARRLDATVRKDRRFIRVAPVGGSHTARR